MPKRTRFMAILGSFLAATLIWGVPVFAQLQQEGVSNKYNKNSETVNTGGWGDSGMTKKPQSSWPSTFNRNLGTGSSGGVGHSGMIKKSQSSPLDKFSLKNRDSGYPDSGYQFGLRTPDQVNKKDLSKKKTDNHTKPHIWPQSQTPGGTIIP
jgi:hypothetical protein